MTYFNDSEIVDYSYSNYTIKTFDDNNITIFNNVIKLSSKDYKDADANNLKYQPILKLFIIILTISSLIILPIIIFTKRKDLKTLNNIIANDESHGG
jgi:hypothetical protein